MSGPTATATAPAAATSPYAAGRRSVAKFPATRATIAGRIRAAPTPSRNDQPNNSTGRFGAIAVVKEPQPYTTQPIANARLRPMIAPIFAPVIISAAITSVYIVIAPWMPVTVVPTSFATVAIETFMTELSRVIRNCPVASVNSTSVAPPARADGATVGVGAARVPLEAVIATSRAQGERVGRSSLREAVIALLRPAVVDVAKPEQDQGEEQEGPEATPGVPRPAQQD